MIQRACCKSVLSHINLMNHPALCFPNEMQEKGFHDLGVWGEKYREESKIAGAVMSEDKHGSCLDLSCVRGKYAVRRFELAKACIGIL